MNIPKCSAEMLKELCINEYQFVSLISKRARELMFGAKPLVENKDISIVETAIKEFITGNIKIQK